MFPPVFVFGAHPGGDPPGQRGRAPEVRGARGGFPPNPPPCARGWGGGGGGGGAGGRTPDSFGGGAGPEGVGGGRGRSWGGGQEETTTQPPFFEKQIQSTKTQGPGTPPGGFCFCAVSNTLTTIIWVMFGRLVLR